MRKFHCIGAALAVVVLASEATAQVIPAPFGPPAFVLGDGVIWHYRSRRLAFGGYLHNGVVYYSGAGVPVIGVYPSVSSSRVAGPLVAPPPSRLLAAGRAVDDEIAGVDLDLVPPKRPPAEPRPEVGPGKPFEMPGVDVSVPKKPVRPEDLVPPKPPEPKKPEPKLPPPKDDPIDESVRLVELGVRAFQDRDYGLAALRFRQALVLEPVRGRAHFLLAQAQRAVGKYRDAVQSIETGVRRQPDWPKAAFHPRAELYKADEPLFDEHVQRLKQALDRDPENPAYLFLYGYELWFDGRKAEAVPLFQKARSKAADPAAIDAFLKAAPAGVLAAR